MGAAIVRSRNGGDVMVLGGLATGRSWLILLHAASIGKHTCHGPCQSYADCYDRIARQDRCFWANCYAAVFRFFSA